MTKVKVCLVLMVACVAVWAHGQAWTGVYEKGLQAAKSKNWAEARTQFQKAVAFRPEDVATPTTLPGPVTEQRQWRNGAPYSPNFLAAYAGMKQAETLSGDDAGTLFKTVADEFEALLAKNENSRETFYFL